jgi:putative methionine-R-sulfoxide reductase with GAF domain
MDQTRDRILQLIASAPDREYAARYAVEELATLPRYHWVGVYWREDDELVLGPWEGPEETEHTRIPIGEGICGAAARSGRTEIVADVSEDERYLACFVETRSEIVVPIKKGDEVIGEIDVDGTEVAAFDQSDANVLEAIAEAIAELA